jgi:hypothetical protein
MSAIRKSPHLKGEESPSTGTPQSLSSNHASGGTPPEGLFAPHVETSEAVASPFKRQRASLPGINHTLFSAEAGFLPATSLTHPTGTDDHLPRASSTPEVKREIKEDEDEEL